MYVYAYLNKTQVTRDRPAHACNFLVELYMQVAAGHLVIVLPIESSSGRPCRKVHAGTARAAFFSTLGATTRTCISSRSYHQHQRN